MHVPAWSAPGGVGGPLDARHRDLPYMLRSRGIGASANAPRTTLGSSILPHSPTSHSVIETYQGFHSNGSCCATAPVLASHTVTMSGTSYQVANLPGRPLPMPTPSPGPPGEVAHARCSAGAGSGGWFDDARNSNTSQSLILHGVEASHNMLADALPVSPMADFHGECRHEGALYPNQSNGCDFAGNSNLGGVGLSGSLFSHNCFAGDNWGAGSLPATLGLVRTRPLSKP